MSQNITRQLVHAVHECFTPGQSKRADKFNSTIDTRWKIYSSSSRQDMLDLAKDFGNFLREHDPAKTRAYSIQRDTVQAYIDSKASTCVDKTIGKIMSRLGKLEQCCKHTYSGSADQFSWNVGMADIPASTKSADFVKDVPVPPDVSRSVISALQEKRSEVGNAAFLSAYAGMRANETTHLKIKDIHFDGGEFGWGYIEIVKGPEGGAKGGRPRVIPILNPDISNNLIEIIGDKKPDDYIAAKADGSRMMPDNVQRALRDVMDAKYGNTYKGNRCHGMRKTWAQNYYDEVRSGGCTKKEAVAKTNEVLGHGTDRGEQLVKMYVKNIW